MYIKAFLYTTKQLDIDDPKSLLFRIVHISHMTDLSWIMIILLNWIQFAITVETKLILIFSQICIINTRRKKNVLIVFVHYWKHCI